MTANIVSVFSDIWGLGTETPRLVYYLRAAVRLLLDNQGTTLLDIRRLLSDDTFRNRMLRNISDNEKRHMGGIHTRQQAQEIGSLQNKVAALADALPLRLIIGQRTSTINIRRIIDSGTVLVVDLSGIGEEPARAISAPEDELMIISRGHAHVRTLRAGHPTLTRPMRTERTELGTGRLADESELRTPP